MHKMVLKLDFLYILLYKLKDLITNRKLTCKYVKISM